MTPSPIIPDGFELVAGRGRDQAKAALNLAEERGFDRNLVKVRPEGYLVPISEEEAAAVATPGEGLLPSGGDDETDTPDDEVKTAIVEEIELPTKKDDIIAFAAENNIDLGDATNNEQRLDAIKAEIQRRTEEAEKSGVLGDGNSIEQADDQNGGDDSADADNAGDNADDTPKGD